MEAVSFLMFIGAASNNKPFSLVIAIEHNKNPPLSPNFRFQNLLVWINHIYNN